jgi:hypothetical protein
VVSRKEWRKVARSFGDVVAVANLILLIFAKPTALTLSLVVVLAPLTLALALKLTAVLACHCVSLALGNRRERAEFLVCAIGAVQPPTAGERYREAMLAEIRFAPSNQIRPIANNLLLTALRTILAAWVRIPRLPRRWAARR